MTQKNRKHFVVCVDNEGYVASLEPRKLYEAIPDEVAKKHNQIRVIDESGEDYLYPLGFFLSVNLPENIEKALQMAA